MEKLPNIKDIKPLPDSNLEHLIFSLTRIMSSYNMVYQHNIEEPSQDKLDSLMRLRDIQIMYRQELETELQKN
jgi:hypothetical protein